MGFASFAGYLLLGAGPLVVAFFACVARKSFLVLLCLGSAFYWLTTLFLASALIRGFEPLPGSAGAYAAVVILSVAIQEGARLLLWRLHRRSLVLLEQISHEVHHAGATLTTSDHLSLSFTHGLAHGGVHSLFLFISWLPLCLGDGTIYAATCPQMSYYMVSALSTLGLAALLSGGMVICFDGLERGNWGQGAAPSAAHLAAAGITLGNFAEGGCLVTVPLLLAGGGGMATWAGAVWWRRTGEALWRRPVSIARLSPLAGGEATGAAQIDLQPPPARHQD